MRLGEILIQRRLITGEDLDRALEIQRERGDKLGKILVDLGFVALRDVLTALAEQLQVPLLIVDGPLDFETRSTVAACTGLTVSPGLASEQEILDAIDRYYGETEKNETELASPAGEASEDLEQLRDMASEAPVIRLDRKSTRLNSSHSQ